MTVMRPEGIRALRRSLGLTQQALADLLGFSFVSVNRWENAAAVPRGLGEIVFELLAGALAAHPAEAVRGALRACDGRPIDVVRALTRMERTDRRTPARRRSHVSG